VLRGRQESRRLLRPEWFNQTSREPSFENGVQKMPMFEGDVLEVEEERREDGRRACVRMAFCFDVHHFESAPSSSPNT
jgi:hypothetical protein